ncbi:glycosyltransferase [Cetobacterium somerae]
MKKIIYIIKDISIVGGREKIILDKANLLSKMGYEVTIISHEMKTLEVKEVFSGINFLNLKLNKFFKNEKSKKIYRFLYLKKLKRELQIKINELNPDIIVGLCDVGFGEYLKLKTSAKKVLEIHGCYDFYFHGIQDYKKIFFIKNYLRKILFYIFFYRAQKYDKVVILSEVDANKWKLENSIVIPNFYQNLNNVLINKNFVEKKFISAGRLSYEKGFDILIEVWKEIKKYDKNIKLDIFGEGPEEKKILSLIKNNKLEKSISLNKFTNQLSKKYKEYYGYILPSRFESFPMVVLESIANALPVIAFDLECGVREMIESEKNGILIKRYDYKKMAEKIIEIYDNEKLREELSKKSLEKSKEYEEEKIIQKWIDLFTSLKKSN